MTILTNLKKKPVVSWTWPRCISKKLEISPIETQRKISMDACTWVHRCLSNWQYTVFGHNMLHAWGYYLDTHHSQNQQIQRNYFMIYLQECVLWKLPLMEKYQHHVHIILDLRCRYLDTSLFIANVTFMNEEAIKQSQDVYLVAFIWTVVLGGVHCLEFVVFILRC